MTGGDHPKLAHRRMTLADLQAKEGPALEVLPALRPPFDAFAARLMTFLEPLTGPSPRLEVDTVEQARDKADIYNSEAHWLSRRFASAAVSADIVVRLDHTFLYAVLDAAFGGDGGGGGFTAERSRTKIELKLAETIFLAVEQALPAAFPGYGFKLESEAKPAQAAAQKPVIAVAEVSLLFSVFGYSGEMIVGLTKSALKLFKDHAAPAAASLEVRPHPDWGSRIYEQLGGAELVFRATLAEIDLDLASILEFRKGQMIPLPVRLDSALKIHCENRYIFDAGFTRSETAYTLVISRSV